MIDRAHLYGDLIFETIRVRNGDICFADKHYNRIYRGAELLKYDLTTFNREVFDDEIQKALNGQADARVRFIMQRDADGFYTPSGNNIKWNVQVFPLDTSEKTCEKLGLFTEHAKLCSDLSNIKSGNALPYVLAGIYAKDNGFDDCILLNQHGRIAETIHSNIFVLRGEELVTPPLAEGCVEGVMRQVVIEIAEYKGVFLDEVPIQPHELIKADEIFLTNAINGIIPVKAYNFKKFTTTFASFLRSFTGF
jgi:branched-chain amino acid aminotransferase